MELIADVSGLAPFRGCVLVPTMGALHEGQVALVRAAASRGGRVVVSIFVNPTQFNDPGDLARYPRTMEQDAALCERAGADAIFAPSVEVMYPPGREVVVPPLPEVATRPGLEDAHRPGHFAGVCQVVKRLFGLVQPGAALFGEKDWQQLRVIDAMTRQQGLGVEVVPVPTVREHDGLAMSSRNVFLSAQDRERALALSEALCAARAAASPGDAEREMQRVLASRADRVEYAVVRDAETLMPVDAGAGRPMRALIGARVGAVRLIDNAAWGK